MALERVIDRWKQSKNENNVYAKGENKIINVEFISFWVLCSSFIINFYIRFTLFCSSFKKFFDILTLSLIVENYLMSEMLIWYENSKKYKKNNNFEIRWNRAKPTIQFQSRMQLLFRVSGLKFWNSEVILSMSNILALICFILQNEDFIN